MDKALRDHLGRVVRENCERLDLSQEKLSQLIGGATHKTISNIERGRTVPSFYQLYALLVVFNIRITGSFMEVSTSTIEKMNREVENLASAYLNLTENDRGIVEEILLRLQKPS